jgi:hypothetical protein
MRRLSVVLAGFLCACGVSFSPQIVQIMDNLEPLPATASADGELAVYETEGLRVEVQPMSDEQLNALFPDDSQKGQFSTNPYTYGDWIDPVKAYTPKRFTVFRVTVINDIYAKVLLDPLKARLYTDQGEMLHSYGIPSFSPHESFERYYRELRGQSGNEFYRFDLRMGNVRSSAYLENQIVFKGERYAGLIAFDPLREEVDRVRLELPDFVLRFDASGQPVESVDIRLDFDRRLSRGPMAAAE